MARQSIASRVWIEQRITGSGVRFRVRYRTAGRECVPKYGGTFKTKREAEIRARRVGDLLAAGEPVDFRVREPKRAALLRDVAAAWQASRVDVRESTTVQHRVALARVLPALGDRPVDEITVADVAALVGDLSGKGKARESIRKSVTALAMVLA